MLDWRSDWARLRRVSLGGMWRAAVRFRRFPVIASGTALMNAFNLRMPALLLAIYYGPAVAGCFALAQRVFALPSSVIGESVAQVYFGEVAAAHEAGPGRPDGPVPRHRAADVPAGPAPHARRHGRGTVPVPAGLRAGLEEAGLFVVALAPMALAQFTAACADSTLVVLERQDLALYREVLRSGLLLGGIVAAYLLKWHGPAGHLPVRRHRHPGLRRLRPGHLVRHPPARPRPGGGP